MTGGSRFVKTLFLLFILTFATLLVFYAYVYAVNLWGILWGIWALCSAQIQDKHSFAGKRDQYINKWKFPIILLVTAELKNRQRKGVKLVQSGKSLPGQVRKLIWVFCFWLYRPRTGRSKIWRNDHPWRC